MLARTGGCSRRSATSINGLRGSLARSTTAMATLDIDMGNTRTKWRCGGETGALPSPKLPAPVIRPARVRVATVLRNEADLAEEVRERFGVPAEFAQVQRRLGGMVCGYHDPAHLGVDRWLATLAAWHRARRALVVVCAGTACTVDLVAADGRHQGGYIAPGLRLLREVLRRRTVAIGVPSSAPPNTLAPGVDTPSAVYAGTAAMLLGYVECVVADFRGRHEAALFVTGGDADDLAGHLPGPLHHVPTLVLDGLAVALP